MIVPACTMREALADPALLGNALAGDSWSLHRTLLIALNGEPLDEAERRVFEEVTGRAESPMARVVEALFVVGRRGGKDRLASVLAAYLAAFVDWSRVLAPGERAVGLIIAPNQQQAKIQRDYIEGVFDSSPILRQLVVNRTVDAIELSNGITIQVRAANFRTLRGVTCIFVIATETSFWYDENGANSDAMILGSVRPSLATTGGPLIRITTPGTRTSEDWKDFERHFGPQGDPSILVVHGTSRRFNPTLPQSVVDRAMERDPHAARAEYLAEFRSDVAALLAEDAIAAVVPDGRRELPPGAGRAVGHFDAATGSGQDAAALAIAYRPARRGDAAELALVRRWRPPFSPAAVAQEAATLLRAYGLAEVGLDRFASGLVAELFREQKVDARVAELDTSGAFVELLGLVNSKRVRLLDVPELLAELRRLERRAGSGGRERVGHPERTGAHDDVAAAAAFALAAAAARESTPMPFVVASGRVGGRLTSTHAEREQTEEERLAEIGRLMKERMRAADEASLRSFRLDQARRARRW